MGVASAPEAASGEEVCDQQLPVGAPTVGEAGASLGDGLMLRPGAQDCAIAVPTTHDEDDGRSMPLRCAALPRDAVGEKDITSLPDSSLANCRPRVALAPSSILVEYLLATALKVTNKIADRYFAFLLQWGQEGQIRNGITFTTEGVRATLRIWQIARQDVDKNVVPSAPV